MQRILIACKEAGKLCITYSNSEEEARRYLEQGYDGVANGLDFLIYSKAYKKMIEEIRR